MLNNVNKPDTILNVVLKKALLLTLWCYKLLEFIGYNLLKTVSENINWYTHWVFKPLTGIHIGCLSL